MAESFFATVKVELVHDDDLITCAAAHAELFECIEIFR